MDFIGIVNLIVGIGLAVERIYRRLERYLETCTPQPTTHLEMPPPPQVVIEPPTPHPRNHRRVLSIDV